MFGTDERSQLPGWERSVREKSQDIKTMTKFRQYFMLNNAQIVLRI